MLLHKISLGLFGNERGVTARRRASAGLLLAALALCLACGATRPPDAAGPRPANAPAYPVLLTENAERRGAANAAWQRLTREQGVAAAPAPELQPVTAALRSIPPLAGAGLYLPKVGETGGNAAKGTQEPGEGATTEALRRFVEANSDLIGAKPQELSLVQLVTAADNTRRAVYEQRPFLHPLAGGYGRLEIRFAPDRRILQITSTCVPNVEAVQRTLVNLRPGYQPDEAAAILADSAVTYADAQGQTQSYTIAAGDPVTTRQLVIYPIARGGQDSPALEFHLAWEVIAGRAPRLAVYIDAVTQEVIAATLAPAT